MVMPMGWMAPAPTPCTSRNRIIDGIDQANPHSSEPNRKIAMPESITFFRPSRSESFPNTTVVAVCVSRNAENTQL